MPYLNGAQAVIATLHAHQVDTIFGIPGNHTLPLYDALRAEPALRHISGRHEQGVGFMAEGYARASGKPGIACTITGPGVTNIATPVANAYADSVPLLVISSSVSRAATGRARGVLHDIKDQLGAMEALTGWARAVTHVEEIPDALRDALRALRLGRPRGAYLQIPYDILKAQAEIAIPVPGQETLPPPSEAQISAAAQLLRTAQRPIIIAGAGVTAAGANALLAHLAEQLQAPVLLGSKSHDVLPSSHPLVVTATGGDLVPELKSLLTHSDVALVVGSKLGAERTADGRLPLPETLIHIDIDPAEIGRQYRATLGIAADARLALSALREALQDMPQARTFRSEEVAATVQALRAYTQQALGTPVALLDSLRAALPQEAITVVDMTIPGYASPRYFPVYEPRTFIHPVEFCAIGCGLPLALGAKAASPQRPVIALCGDGGFQLNAGELATAVQERLDVIVVVFNDQAYTAVKKTQHLRYADRYIATDVTGPDFVALARAFGVRGLRVQSASELQNAVSTVLQEGGTTLIEVPLPPWHWYV